MSTFETDDRFGHLPLLAPDSILALAAKANADPHPDKIMLSIGVYRDDEGNSHLKVVKKAEKIYAERLNEGKESKGYDLVRGFKPFCDESLKLLLGDSAPFERVASCVGVGGTGALRVAAELLAASAGVETTVYFPQQTWGTHIPIFENAGLENQKSYKYFHPESLGLNFEGMCEDLRAAPEGSIVVYHMCAHNPTGCDPTEEQWQEICKISKERRFRVLIDSAYHGFATGSLEKDAYPMRLFANAGFPDLLVCQSFSKNMGLYGDRLGCFSMICQNANTASLVQAYIESKVIPPMILNPPRAASRVAHLIMSDPELRQEWEAELVEMTSRVQRMRQLTVEELNRLQTPGDWSHFTKHIGMFSFSGLTPTQCQRLQDEYHVYVLSNGRVNMAGLTEKKVPAFAAAVDAVVRHNKI